MDVSGSIYELAAQFFVFYMLIEMKSIHSQVYKGIYMYVYMYVSKFDLQYIYLLYTTYDKTQVYVDLRCNIFCGGYSSK